MSQKKKKKESTTATITINNPKAAVLDYRQLKITLQTASKSISHRLPPCTDISKHFSRFGDCKVESIGKSNQYLIKYTTPNSGCIACRTISKENNTLINKVWNISSIKYQWNSYCSSIFHPNKSNLSICAKGPQKCGKIHQLVHNDQAFVPIGNKTKDNLSFEKFKQLRWQLYREHDTVHDIEDWHNIEGITTVNINDNEYESESDSSSSSSMLLGTMTKREPIVAGAVTSSHIERMREKKRKELLSGILKKQVKNGNAEWKCLSQRNRARANAEKLLKQKKKKRASPPLRPVQCNKIEEVSDVVSVGSYRSARSTVYVKPDRDVTVTDSSSSDSESSSSRSASGLFNTKGALGFKNDWNKLNDENNKSKKVKSERKVKKNDKDKSDAISMRYLNKNKKKIVSKSNKVDKKIKSVRKVKAVHVPCTPSPSPPPVPESVKEKENGSESSNAKTVSSMTSAEKTAYRAVRSVLGENKVNLVRSRVGNRVPIIDPNKRSVSYLQSKRSMITHQNNYGNSNVNMNMNQSQNNIRGGFHTLPNNNQNNSNRMRMNLNNMGGMGNMNQMSNVMMQQNNMNQMMQQNNMNNMNNMNQMGNNRNMNALINAPPFFPTFQNQPQPRAPMSNFMNSMNVSGSILAGTFKTNTQLQQPPSQTQPQQTIYNQSPPNMYNQSPVYNNKYNQSNQKIQNQNNINNQNQNNQNQNNMNKQYGQYTQNKNQNNLNQNKNKNNIKSSPTSTLKRAQLRKQHLRKQPKIIDYSDAKYDYKHVTILHSPSSVEDYHWLCFHFRSGEKYSCTYGSECRWRHYDFEMRADIQTAWNPSNPIIKYKPRMPQLAEARILRKSIEKKYKWLADKKYSKNPYIHENNTPPSMKKIRVENHKRNKQIIENKDGDKVKVSSRKKLIIENDQDEKEKININKDKKKDIDNEVHVINNAEENKDKDEGKDKNEGNIINDKIKCVLRDYDTAMSMMTPFCNDSRNNPNVNYHLIGQLAYQQFAALRKIICELKK